MKEEYQDRIEDYLFERMSDAERLTFEKDLEKDAELRDQYEFVSMVKTALMLENIDNDVSEWSKAYREREAANQKRTVACMKIEKKTPRSSMRHVLFWISGIAAVFIVGFFMYKSINFYEAAPSKQDNVAYNPHPQGVSTIRGVDATTENLLAKADYEGALSRIESLEDEISTKLIVIEREKDSRGSGQDDSEEEIEMLKYRQEELSWLKVQALLGLNRIDRAIELLDKIRSSESEYKKQADSLYNVLKERK